MGEDAVGLIPSGTSFEVIGHEDIVFDSSKLAALVYTACHLRADRRLSDPEPLSAYGLDARGVGLVRWSDGRLVPSSAKYVYFKDEMLHAPIESRMRALGWLG